MKITEVLTLFDKPNIIFIMADQLPASFLGCYGSSVPSTPRLDEMASKGVMFHRAYATHPLCAPNRATILTGRSSEIHGITGNNYALQTDTPTYAHILRKHGYYLGGFGKFHQTPMAWPVPENVRFLGFDESVVTEDPKWGPWVDWVKDNHPDQLDIAISMTNGHSAKQGVQPELELSKGATQEEINIKIQAFPNYMQPRISNSQWDRMYASPLIHQAHDTTYITNRGLEFIKKCNEQNNGPFFCHISYVDPHDPYDPPAPYDAMFQPDDMVDPLPAEWMDQGPFILDEERDNYLKFRNICDNKDAIKKMRALYHGSLKYLDDQIGRIIDYVEETNLWENTIIVFTTDHGDMMGDHGFVSKGRMHYDKGIRCPLIIAGGPIVQASTDRLTCSLDFVPTFCDWAGVSKEHLPPLEGKSFASLCKGEQENSSWDEVSVSLRGVETIISGDGYRLTLYIESGEGQMFDLKKDPDEQINLYNHKEIQFKKIALLEKLIALRARPKSLAQYRNLPVKDGKKFLPENNMESMPKYDTDGSPWLENTGKHEWRT
jgi:arylsulfatase